MWPAPLVSSRSEAWRAGYLAYLGGMGEECPYAPETVDAIDWRDGHDVAMRLLRELPED